MESVFNITIVVCLGLIFGSFATALVYRVPKGISWGAKRSSCSSCGTPLNFFDLVPLVSWCVNGGVCCHCKAKVSVSYPLIELASLMLCLGVYSTYGLSVSGIFIICAVPFLLALLLIDVKHMILPNQLVAIVFFIGVLRLFYFWHEGDFLSKNGLDILTNYFLAALIFSFLSWGTGTFMSKILNKNALGFGDVKFFGVAGIWLGLDALPLFMVISGGLAVFLALTWRLVNKSEEFPFGPALISALFILLFYQGILLSSPEGVYITF